MYIKLLSLAMLFLSSISYAQEPLDLELKNFEYPYPVKYFDLEIQDEKLRMAFMQIEPSKPNGQTITLFHGKNFCGAYFKQVIQDLVDQGFKVIVPDQIGFGKSSKPKRVQYSFHMLAENTKNLLNSIGVKQTHVLGHSMGGMLAVRFALMYKEDVSKLILVNPIGLEDYKRKVMYQKIEKLYQEELKKTEEGIRSYQKENYYHGEWKPEYEPWVQLLYRWSLNPEYPRLAWNAALTSEMVYTQPVVYEFGDLKAQTLLIIGQLDRTAIGKNLTPPDVRKTLGNYPELGRATQGAIPNAKLVELSQVGHVPHIEAYEKFWIALQEFLTN
jgi:pimeloyl-ACP methyl ester carboxylesterase